MSAYDLTPRGPQVRGVERLTPRQRALVVRARAAGGALPWDALGTMERVVARSQKVRRFLVAKNVKQVAGGHEGLLRDDGIS